MTFIIEPDLPFYCTSFRLNDIWLESGILNEMSVGDSSSPFSLDNGFELIDWITLQSSIEAKMRQGYRMNFLEREREDIFIEKQALKPYQVSQH